MPTPRKRYDEADEPMPCVVTISAAVAKYLYREKLDGGYKDETELVNMILRKWAESRPEVDWKDVLRRLKADGRKRK